MKPRLRKSEPMTVQPFAWKWNRRGCYWQSGNVRIIVEPNHRGDYCWFIRMKLRGRWRRFFPSSRRHGYGSSHYAKIGVQRWKRGYLNGGD